MVCIYDIIIIVSEIKRLIGNQKSYIKACRNYLSRVSCLGPSPEAKKSTSLRFRLL